MATPIIIPKLGLTMKTATVVKWLKSEGDEIKKGDVLVQIETDKVTNKIESPESGVLLKIFAGPKKVVPVGAVVGYVGAAGETVPAESLPVQPSAVPKVVGSVASKESVVQTKSEVRISPRARRLAMERNVDVARVAEGREDKMIMENDVLEYIQNKLSRTNQGLKVKETISMSPTRRAISENMVSSLQSMAQVTITMDCGVEALQKIHASLTGPTYTDILVKVVARLLRSHPILNSTLEEDEIKIIEEINIGVAVAAETGLVVPVIRHADEKSLNEISSTLRKMAEKSRSGTLSLDDVSGGSFTITNLGSYGVEAFTPIINPPQAAILGIGSMKERPTASDGKIVLGSFFTLSLTFDHRIMDGHVAATFLQELKNTLEDSDLVREILLQPVG